MQVPRPTALRALAAAGLVAALGLLAAPAASAHNVVVSTEPAASSTVTTLPTQVVLHFEEPPVAGGTAIVVKDPEGTAVTSGAAVLTGSDASVALLPLSLPGPYVVDYRSASDDGHTITGSFTFTVPQGALPSTSPTPSATTSPTRSSAPTTTATPAADSGGSAWPLLLGVLGVVVVVGIVVALLRRRSA
ncbi:MAG TPA: copper resistance CopC family protein [Candidatus Nanopelagicales bacterium]|nr:copper resistance CopC family protein [Candidatus Nanopelagicales bacterium]